MAIKLLKKKANGDQRTTNDVHSRVLSRTRKVCAKGEEGTGRVRGDQTLDNGL